MAGKKKLTFFKKNPRTCPVCGAEVKEEEMLTGRGRVIAGEITDELRRTYEEHKEYGKACPLLYEVTVCPSCFYATLSNDFDLIEKDGIKQIKNNEKERKNNIYLLFPDVDFTESRTLEAGIASYLLAITCYSFFPSEIAPTFKKGMCSLRAAWLFGDLFEKTNNDLHVNMQALLYEKATIFYNQAIEYAQNGKEVADNIKQYGPDTDKNFGYDGMLYIASLLSYKLSFLEEDLQKKGEKFVSVKHTVARLFGLGKTDKKKPGVILDMVRDLYQTLGKRIKEIEEELGMKLD